MLRKWVLLALKVPGFRRLEEDERHQVANNAAFAVRTGNGPNGSTDLLPLVRKYGGAEGVVRAKNLPRIRKLASRAGYPVVLEASLPFVTNDGRRPSYGGRWRRLDR